MKGRGWFEGLDLGSLVLGVVLGFAVGRWGWWGIAGPALFLGLTAAGAAPFVGLYWLYEKTPAGKRWRRSERMRGPRY